MHHLCVIDDADDAPGVGNGIFLIGVELAVEILRVDLREIGDIAVIDLFKHALVDHSRDHIVGGDYDVIIDAALLEHGIELFVCLVYLVVDLDAGLFFEIIKDRFVDVFAPVIDIYDLLGRAAAAAGQNQAASHGSSQNQCQCFLHK